jgi:hypothetical protein
MVAFCLLCHHNTHTHTHEFLPLNPPWKKPFRYVLKNCLVLPRCSLSLMDGGFSQTSEIENPSFSPASWHWSKNHPKCKFHGCELELLLPLDTLLSVASHQKKPHSPLLQSTLVLFCTYFALGKKYSQVISCRARKASNLHGLCEWRSSRNDNRWRWSLAT